MLPPYYPYASAEVSCGRFAPVAVSMGGGGVVVVVVVVVKVVKAVRVAAAGSVQ